MTAGQLGLLAPALAEPYRLDDATVARIVRVHFDQAADLVLELLVSQLPVVHDDDPSRDEVVALRADILGLVTEIRIGLVDPD